MGRSLLKENLLGFVVFSDCLVPSYCNHLVFNPACGFTVHRALETPEVHKWPAADLTLPSFWGRSSFISISADLRVRGLAPELPPCYQKQRLIAASTSRPAEPGERHEELVACRSALLLQRDVSFQASWLRHAAFS